MRGVPLKRKLNNHKVQCLSKGVGAYVPLRLNIGVTTVLAHRKISWSAAALAALGLVCLPLGKSLRAQQTDHSSKDAGSLPSWMFEGFAARKSPSGSPLFGGMGFTKYGGVFGLRVSGALNLQNDSTSVVTPGTSHLTLGAWSAGADLIFEPLRAQPSLKWTLLGFSPYAFAGVGGYGVHPTGYPDTSYGTWSYGFGLHHDLFGQLGIQAEARYRHPFGSEHAPTGVFKDNIEYNVGLTIGFGHHQPPVKTEVPKKTTTTGPSTRSTVAPPVDAASARFASRVLDDAEGLLYTPYRQGGTSPQTGLDAGGFVQYVFGQEGVRLPRTARQIAAAGDAVGLRSNSLRPGDLLFFANQGRTIDHVAIFAGRDRIIHATASGGGVRYDVLGDGERGKWFSDHLVAACRIRAPATAPADESPDPPDHAPPSPRAQ